MLAAGLREYQLGSAEDVVRRMWPKDEQTLAIIKAATSPADTTTSGWASQLATTAIADLVMTLGPTAAGGDLMKRAMTLEFGRTAQVNAPGIVSTAIGASAWIAQLAPIPVRQFSVGAGATLTPRKTAAAFVVTREMLEHSTPNAEKFIRAAATESIGAEIDSAMFDATAASTTRPAGLRNGVTTTTATAGGDDLAMMKDLGALAQAVAAVGGMNIAFVASPGEAVKIALRAGPNFKFPVLASGGLAAGFVMCVALPALVSAIDPAVRFEASKEATIHMEDTTPLAIGTAGSPNTVAAPTRNLFQTDCVGFKLLLEVSWGLRAANAVSWTSAVTW
jgi:hypothetical protein